MEVAGLVLGALPVAIQAFQTYQTILSSVRNAERDLKSMIRDLNNEVLILQNTCELLLRGIASDSEIENMIENPFSGSWKKYEDEVRLRLWRSGPSFQDLAEDMMKATAELQAKLAINDQGKTRLTDRASIFRELKLRTSFTLKKEEYTKILARLHNSNAALCALVDQNNKLEPSRLTRAQGTAARLTRRLSAGVFSALQGAMTCSCIGSHDIGLGIPKTVPVMVPTDKEEDTARSLYFDLVLGTHEENSQILDRLRAKLAKTEVAPQVPIASLSGSRSPKERARWASSFFTGSEKVDLNSSSFKSTIDPPTKYVSNTTSVRPPIANLCQILRKGKGVSPECYGSINGVSNSFDLFHQDCPAPSCTTVTLREILNNGGDSMTDFGYCERLHLALRLSVGVLSLYSTPWLSTVVTLDDIVFLHGKDTEGHGTYFFDRPFLAKPISEASSETRAVPLTSTRPQLGSPQQQPSLKIMRRPMNSTLLSLGLLLIQIIIGEYFDQLRIEEGMTIEGMAEKQTIAFKMAGLVVQNGGPNFAAAVKWCLKHFDSVANLGNDELAGQFYNGVIVKLETDMKFQSTTAS